MGLESRSTSTSEREGRCSVWPGARLFGCLCFVDTFGRDRREWSTLERRSSVGRELSGEREASFCLTFTLSTCLPEQRSPRLTATTLRSPWRRRRRVSRPAASPSARSFDPFLASLAQLSRAHASCLMV